LLLTVRRSQRKIYEIYDRQMFSAIGNQSDIENLRVSAINMAHQEGFERSPDDVTLQRMVGFALSPALKKAFGDHLTMPFVVKGMFAELGKTAAGDAFVTLNYDGEYRQTRGAAVIGGTQVAEDRMLERLGAPDPTRSCDEALYRAFLAWTAGARAALRSGRGPAPEDDLPNPLLELDEAEADQEFVRGELATGAIEAAVLERRLNREMRFRMLSAKELETLAARFS